MLLSLNNDCGNINILEIFKKIENILREKICEKNLFKLLAIFYAWNKFNPIYSFIRSFTLNFM